MLQRVPVRLGHPEYGTYCGVQGFHDLDGSKPYIIFYDPEQLGQVANGSLAAHMPQPYAAININDLPVVHVWKVADAGGTYVPPAEPPPPTEPPPVNPCRG